MSSTHDAEGYQYGVRFRDGSVRHAWNGRTQRQRATEELARLRQEYPGDAPSMRLVRRRRGRGWAVAPEHEQK